MHNMAVNAMIQDQATHNRLMRAGGYLPEGEMRSRNHSWLNSFNWAVFPDPIPCWEMSVVIQDPSGPGSETSSQNKIFISPKTRFFSIHGSQRSVAMEFSPGWFVYDGKGSLDLRVTKVLNAWDPVPV